MSGLASILMKEGFRISGSDSRKSDLTQALEAAGQGPVRETYLYLLAAGRAIDAQTENVV